MDKFVCGFLFDYDLDRFLLIDKGKIPVKAEREDGKPILTSLKWSGIGGKVNPAIIPDPINPGMTISVHPETPHQCMEREFFEETGIRIPRKRWHCFFIKQYGDYTKLFFFCAFGPPKELENIASHFKDGLGPEGHISVHTTIDILFDSELYTFDIPYLVNMIVRESRRGFLPKLDPEGTNSENRKNP